MANWYGSARSNFVRVADLAALKNALAPFDIQVQAHPERPEYVYFSGSLDSGGWPASGLDAGGNEIDFAPVNHICPHLKKGEVLIMVEVGAEKLGYLTGYAVALTTDGRTVALDIRDIYDLALRRFGVSADRVAEPLYASLPSCVASEAEH